MSITENLLTEQEAFRAMRIFLQDYWMRTGKGNEIGALLGDIEIIDENACEIADPAAAVDWSGACDRVRMTRSRDQLR